MPSPKPIILKTSLGADGVFRAVGAIAKPAILAATWSELHLRGLNYEGGNDSEWLIGYASRIRGFCFCHLHWRDMLHRIPPDYANYFEWTVAAHNDVNCRLGKPVVFLEQARAIWQAQRGLANSGK